MTEMIRRSGVTLTASRVVKQKKIFAGTWSFNKRLEISSSVEKMVLPGGSKLEENETDDEDTLIVHYTAVCLHFLLDRLLYA